MSTPAWPPGLPPFLAMIEGGVSAIACSHDAQLWPSVMRAVGTDVDRAAGALVVYLSRRTSQQLLDDVAAGRGLAVVYSQPSTHLTVQVKCTEVLQRPANAADLPAIERYVRAMVRELRLIGYSGDFARALVGTTLDDTVALWFRPAQAFDQTPGVGRTTTGAAT